MAAKSKRGEAASARWNRLYTTTERELAKLVKKYPPLSLHDRCDFACPGVAVFNESEVERCDACGRFPDDEVAARFVTLLLQASAMGCRT